MLISRYSAAAVLVAAIAASATAQDSVSNNSLGRAPTPLELRSTVSVSLIQTRPQGALAENVGLGYGLNGAYLFRLDRAGVFSIRADVGVVEYGDESQRTALSGTVGGRVQVNVRTTNYIVPMSVGPQIMWPTGLIRPYVNAGIGGQAFFTESRVDNVANGSSVGPAIAYTTNQSDFVASWVVGGGIYAPISAGKAGQSRVLLDLGVQYVNGGNARYLAPGSIVDLPNGEARITASSSTTHLVVVRAGLRIGL
jgi:hypothetical protein